MAKESEISRRVTRAVKAGDKLVQDVKKDIGQLVAAASAVKEFFDDMKNPKGPDGPTEV